MNYKSVTLVIIAVSVGLSLIIKYLTASSVVNYIYMGQLNLNTHLLSVEHTDMDKIFFLGSSAVAGKHIPLHTTIVDYFNQANPDYKSYNMAAFQFNLLDSNIIFNLYKNKFPKIAILGIDPSVIDENQSSLFSKRYSEYADQKLKSLMTDYLCLSFKDRLEMLTNEEPVSPTMFQAWWKSFLLRLRYDFWGPLFYKKLYSKERYSLAAVNSPINPSWQLIDTFIKTAKENNIAPVVFIEPILNSTYSQEDLNAFINRMKEKSVQLNFTLYDYSSFLPSKHDYFYDFVHLTPEGYKELAQKLAKDLITSKIIKERAK